MNLKYMIVITKKAVEYLELEKEWTIQNGEFSVTRSAQAEPKRFPSWEVTKEW